jgi:hypothetical protein
MKLSSVLVSALLMVPSSAAHALAQPDLQIMGSLVLVNPSAVGGEGGASLLFAPIEGHPFMLGPKVTFLAAQGNGQTRLDLNTGIEGTVWLVNAIGPGLAFDVVAPSNISGQGSSIHFRMEPNLAVRLLHARDSGAWAVRVGLPYDSGYQWGLQLGVTLQLSGLPKIGEDTEQ